MARKYRILADFTADLLKPLLLKHLPGSEVTVAPYGQVFQGLKEHPAATETLVVFSRIENTLPSFQALSQFDPVDKAALDRDVDYFASELREAARHQETVLVFSWSIPLGMRGHGMADYRPGQGLRYAVNRANNRLADQLADVNNVFLLDIERVLINFDAPKTNARFWYAGKVPFTLPFFEVCAREIAAAIHGLSGTSRRLIVVDLDNTLWGGILGDVGWEGLKLGGHDHVGEAHVDFQRALKALTRRGIILALASKNYENNALEAIEKHPEMVLRKDDFACWRINWQDKAQNIIEIAKAVNLGLASVVFLDDNPAERARVREALPDVLVPEWPEDPTDYTRALHALTCFDLPALSEEDKKRAAMFVEERARQELQQNAGSEEDWLRSIDMKVQIAPLNSANQARIVQLFNKTNQFNLATRRANENELATWVAAGDRYLWGFRVSDRFGDTGLTGIVTLDVRGEEAEVVDFIMSCRVMGRKIEEAMLGVALAKAAERGAKLGFARFQPTKRNQPMLEFLKRSGLSEDEENLYRWNLESAYPQPDFLTISMDA